MPPRAPIPDDDSFHHHPRSPDPFWNESSWFGFMVPERRINGYFYVWHRPNMKLTAGGVAIWDHTGSEHHTCLHSDWFNFNPLTDDTDMFSYTLENGMSCELLEPLNAYRLRYVAPTCTIALDWHGVLPAQNLDWAHQPSGYEEFGGFHYEQAGRVTGTIALAGEPIAVDCHHVRDRSWGLRKRIPYMGRGGVDSGWASANTSFFVTLTDLRSTTPLNEPSVESVGYGAFVKDGELSHVRRGERRVLERDRDGRPIRLMIELEDARGRTLHADGIVVNCLNWNDIWFVHWCLVEWDFDGEPGWGETQDIVDKTLIRAHVRRAPIGA